MNACADGNTHNALHNHTATATAVHDTNAFTCITPHPQRLLEPARVAVAVHQGRIEGVAELSENACRTDAVRLTCASAPSRLRLRLCVYTRVWVCLHVCVRVYVCVLCMGWV